jgi:iron complex transport system substrate-binding protein
MNMKKILLIITILLTAGCSVIPGLNQPVEITDSTGHTETLDGAPERIAIVGKATIMVQDAIYLFDDAVEKVIALENRNQSTYSFLPVVDPNLDGKDIFEKNVGPEQIAAVQPDLILMKSSMAEKLGEPLEQLSLPVLYLDLETPEAFYKDIHTLGQVFGNPKRAEEITEFYQSRVSRIEENLAGVTEDQKPSVLVLEYSDVGGEIAFKVPPISWLQTTLVEISGGTPVWKDLEVGGGWIIVNVEQVAAWDPDQIYIISYDGNASAVKAELMESPIWSSFRAVQNDQLFAFAYDFYSWDQPDTRWILGLQWLATKIQPELNSNIDIMEEVNAFYSVLYGLDQEAIDADVIPNLTGDLP